MSHTPGPWTWSSRGTLLVGGDNDQVLAIDLPEFIEDADKHLIAAAPDLLEALKAARKVIREVDIQDGNDWIADAVEQVADAIAKAEGRT